ncbi:MAG TPA: rhodanese-like domain-containing protein [Candidatus Tumulicola sp.]
MAGVRDIEVETLRDWRDAKTPHVLLDVREPVELETAAVDGVSWIPMGEIVSRMDEIPRDVPVVVMCHHGSRSTRVAEYLEGAGLANVYNLAGGIDAYAERVDESVPRY